MTLEHVPRLKCSRCHISASCDRYEEDAVCGFAAEFWALAEKAASRDVDSLVEIEVAMLQLDLTRYLRAVRFETALGGKLDRGLVALSKQISQRAQNIMAMKSQIDRVRARVSDRERGTIRVERQIVEIMRGVNTPEEITRLANTRRNLIRVERLLLEAGGVSIPGQTGSSASGQVVAEVDEDEPPPSLSMDFEEVSGEGAG